MTQITQMELNKYCTLVSDEPWKEVTIELCRGNTGTVRAYLNGRALPFRDSGYGYSYDKHGVVLSDFLNYYVGHTVSNNSGEGVAPVIADAKLIGVKVEHVCDTCAGSLYRFRNVGYMVRGVA